MKVITAIEASRRLKVSEKTIRLWVEKGILRGTHPLMPNGQPRKNRLAIPEEEIARIQRSSQQYDYSDLPEDASLAERVIALEQEVARLSQLLPAAAAEKPVARALPTTRAAAPAQPPKARSTPSTPPQAMTGDMIPLRLFAQAHGINERTAGDQIRKGYRGAYLAATKREDAPPGQDKWFFSPEQQREAITFWQEKRTPGFHPCEHCPH